MGLGKKLISNTAFLLIDFLAVSVFSYAFWSIIGKFQFLSTTDYGIIVVVINTSVILSSISFFGFNNVIQRFIPEFIQTKKKSLVNKLIVFSFKIIFSINVVMFIVLIFFSNQIAPLLKIEPMHIVLIGILMLATSLANFSGAVLQGFQEMKKFARTDAIGYFIKAAGTFSLLFLFQQNTVPIIVFTASLFVIFLLRINFAWFRSKSGKLNYRDIVSNYTFPSFVGGVAWLIFTNAQYLILTVIQDPATTGVFSVAAIVTTLIATIPNTMSSALFPILSQLSVSPTFKKYQEFLIARVLRYSFFISIPLTLLFSIFSSKIVIIFSRSQFLEATSLFPILSFAALLGGVGMFFLSSLYALKKIKQNRNIILLSAIVFLSLSIVLTKMFSAMGLAIGYTATIVVLLSASLLYLRKIVAIKIPYSEILKNIVAAAVWLGIFYAISPFATNNLLQLVFMFITFPAYLLVLLPLRYYNEEDIRVIEFFKSNSPRFARHWIEKMEVVISKFV